MSKKWPDVIKLSKICQYEKGIKDMFGFHYYFIDTEVSCEKDVEYFEKRGWFRRTKLKTFWDMFKRKKVDKNK